MIGHYVSVMVRCDCECMVDRQMSEASKLLERGLADWAQGLTTVWLEKVAAASHNVTDYAAKCAAIGCQPSVLARAMTSGASS